MAMYTDQTGHRIQVPHIPERIVSLVPSQTELLHYLGLGEKVCGITKFCVHPQEWFHTKTRIGGPKSIAIDRVKTLEPDLIIANKEENFKEEVDALAAFCPVYTSNISTLQQALEMIEAVGSITDTAGSAATLITAISNRFAALPAMKNKPRAAYLIWQDPYMAAGGDTFINDMMAHAGFTNIFAGSPRYPQCTLEELARLKCEILLLSSEPFPFQQKHLEQLQQLLPAVKILLADGEMFSWYGSRLLEAPAYFQSLMKELAS